MSQIQSAILSQHVSLDGVESLAFQTLLTWEPPADFPLTEAVEYKASCQRLVETLTQTPFEHPRLSVSTLLNALTKMGLTLLRLGQVGISSARFEREMEVSIQTLRGLIVLSFLGHSIVKLSPFTDEMGSNIEDDIVTTPIIELLQAAARHLHSSNWGDDITPIENSRFSICFLDLIDNLCWIIGKKEDAR
jgi:hypothetical protein